nr:MAG TPA: hypothetical protein [Bacteriophage sp.]
MAQARRQPMCYNSSVDETANRQRRRVYPMLRHSLDSTDTYRRASTSWRVLFC